MFQAYVMKCYNLRKSADSLVDYGLDKHNSELLKRPCVYFTLSIEGNKVGSLIFMLYSELLPITCQYFLNLCMGNFEKGNNNKLHYLNTRVHRVVKNGWIQCGDVGSFGQDLCCDESYCISHNRRGILSMANNGKHSNGPQFFICLNDNSWMDYTFVAFGQLIDGEQILKVIENIPTFYQKPMKEIIITQVGEIAEHEINYLSEETKKEEKICDESSNLFTWSDDSYFEERNIIDIKYYHPISPYPSNSSNPEI